MTYCKQQIPDDFYIVNQDQFPVELTENAEYNKSRNAKRNLHRLYHNRILKLEKTKNEKQYV